MLERNMAGWEYRKQEAWDSDVSLDVQHLLRELEEKQSETVEVTGW